MNDPSPSSVQNPKSAPCRWAIVGCGWVARDYAIPAILRSRYAELVCCSDTSSQALHIAADAISCAAPQAAMPRMTCDLEAVCSDASIDAAYIATPNHAHADAAVRLLEAGKHVLIEKPLASDVSQAVQIADAAHRSGLVAAVAYDQRHHPAHNRIAALIAEGRIGRVTQIRILYACWLPPHWSHDGLADDNWRIDLRRAGGGAVIDLLPHGLDLCSYLMGEAEIESIHIELQGAVHAYSAAGSAVSVDDGGVTLVRLRGGYLVSIHNSYACPDNVPRRLLEIYGSEGAIRAVDTMGQTGGGKLELIDVNGRFQAIPFDRQGPFERQFDWWSQRLQGLRNGSAPNDLKSFETEVSRFKAMMAAMLAAPFRR